MKTPNEYTQIKFRPGTGSNLEKMLTCRSPKQTDSSFSLTARDDLSDYYKALMLYLPPLTHSEREVLLQALGGWHATVEDVDHLWIEVEALIGVYEYQSVDLPSFVVRLQGLSRFECWAIYNAVLHGLWEPARI